MILTALLDSDWLKSEIRRYLTEDIGSGDVTTARIVSEGATTRGWLVARQDCIVAGVDIARQVFAELDAALSFTVIIPDAPVAEAFKRQCKPWYEQIVANKQQSRTLATLRDTLLRKLLSAELSVVGATDEL